MVSTIDIVLIAVYFIAIAVVGYLSSRRESSQDYVIGSKKVGTWLNIATLSATKITASLIITYIALVYVYGISALWIFVGTAIGYILYLLFAIKLKREGDRHNYYSIADYFYHRYGKRSGMLVSIVTFSVLFLNFTIQLIGGAKVLQVISGIPFIISVILCGAVISFYLYLGGFKAVVKTDVVQFVAIIGLFVILGIFLFSNFSYNAAQWNIMSAGPKLIIPFLLVGMLFPFSAPDLWQRTLAAKNVKVLKKSFLLTTGIYVAFGFLLSMIAIVISLKLPGIDPDTALVQGFVQMLPSGLLGAGLIALFATIMSSADSFAFICGGLLMHDILKKEKTARSLKVGIVFVMVLGIATSMVFQSILDTVYLLTGIFMVFSTIVLATWIKKRINNMTLNLGIIVGIIATVLVGLTMGISATLIVVGVGAALLGMLIGVVWKRLRRLTVKSVFD